MTQRDRGSTEPLKRRCKPIANRRSAWATNCRSLIISLLSWGRSGIRPYPLTDTPHHQPVVQPNRYRRALTRSPLSPPHRERPGKTEGYFTPHRDAFGRPIARDTAALIDGRRVIEADGKATSHFPVRQRRVASQTLPAPSALKIRARTFLSACGDRPTAKRTRMSALLRPPEQSEMRTDWRIPCWLVRMLAITPYASVHVHCATTIRFSSSRSSAASASCWSAMPQIATSRER